MSGISIRQRLGQLALAVAALAAIATSAPTVLDAQAEGTPITLDSARAIEVRRFAVQLRAGEDDLPDERSDINGRLSLSLSVRHAADATPQPVHRIVRASVKRRTFTTPLEKTLTTADTEGEGHFQTTAFDSCGDRVCEGDFELVLELLDPTAGSPVVVNWSVGVGTDLGPNEGTLQIVLDR